MRRNSKTTAAILFSLLFAVVISLTAFTATVSAADSDKDPTGKVDKKELYKDAIESGEQIEGQGVHADPATFEKNFCLSADQKEYTITEIEKVISYYLKPEMSDLEKYYTLAKWANQRVVYDNDFWSGGYDLDYYSHQWDAYGAINEDELSVCAGIAIFYSNLCHAADLPCKFARLDPKILDHTISYIPDINGHSYLADITENDFLMSKDACYFAEDLDLGFIDITEEQVPSDSTFEYKNVDAPPEGPQCLGTNIKECWQDKISYKKWFKEYALHEGTDKVFETPYPENAPSSKDGVHYASYADFDKYQPQSYESRTNAGADGAVTGIWFLDDFYAEPTGAMRKIQNKEFDEQFLIISGLKGSYDDYENEEALVNAVKDDISIRYFPSVEDGKVVAKAAELTDEDYTVTYDSHDPETGEEVFTIRGNGQNGNGYTGSCQVRVRTDSAIIKTAPARINGLVYNESPQNLIKPGEAEHGTLLYAVSEPGVVPDEDAYTEAIPTGTDAGSYDVWFKVIGDKIGDKKYSDIPAQKLNIPKDRPVRIAPMSIDDVEGLILSQTAFTYNGKAQKPKVVSTKLKEGTDYIVTWSDDPSIIPGNYELRIDGKGNYGGWTWAEYMINKAANPMTLKGKTAKVKYSKVSKKAQTIKRAKVIKVSKAQGKPAYKLVSAKNGKKNFKKKFKINAKTGNVTVKKGLKKGTYNVKVKVKAAGSANYKASSWKKVTFKVRIK